MTKKYEAIRAIDPNASFETKQEPGGEEIVTWLNGYKPIAENVIAAKIAELETANAHIAPRTKAYDALGGWQEQLDMMYHDEVNGTTTWKDAIAKIKADNPKSE
tara:strand:+ start:1338 stop:1649 length:312 start_codon:yes stop_codon:yes gene_type:complete